MASDITTPDLLKRLKSYSPDWHGENPTIVNSLRVGYSAAYILNYSQLKYVDKQTRIATSTDFLLDLISEDFFKGFLPRKPNEEDDSFRRRILANMLSERATRKGMFDAIKRLTGHNPWLFEPWNWRDTGGTYNDPGSEMSYNDLGFNGSDERYTAYIVAKRPENSFDPALLSSYNDDDSGYNDTGGDYILNIYLSDYIVKHALGDDAILQLINLTKCFGTKMKVKIVNP